jgi:hypothetical protein
MGWDKIWDGMDVLTIVLLCDSPRPWKDWCPSLRE